MRMRMTPIVLLALIAAAPVCLLAVPGVAHAQEVGTAAAAATVVSHVLTVAIDGSGRLTERQTWTVRVDDPAAAEAGIPGPPGLSGASDGDAIVLDDLLIVPADAEPGTIYTLVSERKQRKGPYSGVFRAAPDLAIEQMRVEVTAPSWIPLTIWADDGSKPDFKRSRNRNVHYTWDAPAAGGSQLLWTTWKDWVEAGAAVEADVDSRVASKNQLGPVLAADVGSVRIPEAVERVRRSVTLIEGPQSWTDARHSVEVVQQGKGTATERALVLISLLRAAGVDAGPALFRPASAGGFATTVPAPSLLDRPAVAARTSKGLVWIDPAADHVAVPRTPASMVGGIAWVPGDLPVPVQRGATADGTVIVLTEAKLDGKGGASLTANISATGTAEEWLRRYLDPVEGQGRIEALQKLATTGRPTIERAGLTDSGIDGTRKPVKLTLQAHEGQASQAFGPGVQATVPPLLAPALASWLPPNIRIREEVSITGPTGMQPLLVQPPEPSFYEGAAVGYSMRREGNRITFIAEVERPYRTTTPAIEAAAAEYLSRIASDGPMVRFMPQIDATLIKVMRKSSAVSASQRPGLEALLWLESGLPNKAAKPLKKGIKVHGFDAVLDGALAVTDARDLRLIDLMADLAMTDAERWRLTQAAQRRGAADTWVRAASLTTSSDLSVAVQATLLQAQTQPESPSPDSPSGAWKPIDNLLTTVEVAADAAPDKTAFIGESVKRRAERAIGREEWDEANELLAQANDLLPGDPMALALGALVSAHTGGARENIEHELELASALVHDDPQLFDIIARAYARAGSQAEALVAARHAARVRVTDAASWSRVVDAALPAGDLPAALYAARRASDLNPDDAELAAQLGLLAVLAGDDETAEIAARRGGAPPEADNLLDRMTLVPEGGLLALLMHHDAEVTADARNLGLRAQLRMDMGDLDGAARDGTLLTHRLDEPKGYAIAFAATAGRAWSTSARDHLNTAARRHNSARAVRMEHNLITGAGDPLLDANALKRDDPRAAIVADSIYKPGTAAEQLEWPDLADGYWKAPAGFRTNRGLGAAKGAVAYSDSNLGMSVVRIFGKTDKLPAPLGLLYSRGEVPLSREPDGTTLWQLTGGSVPVYLAQFDEETDDGPQSLLGIAHTATGAKRALAVVRSP